MSNGVNFYIRRYGKDEQQVDIEKEFHCIYSSLKNSQEWGAVKNVYTESYPGEDGVQVYVPETPAFEAVDCELTLLFQSSTAMDDEQKFMEFVQGKRFEWYDTFRKRYIEFYSAEQPTLVSEKLYAGKGSYREVKYKFKNFMGRTYTESQYETLS